MKAITKTLVFGIIFLFVILKLGQGVSAIDGDVGGGIGINIVIGDPDWVDDTDEDDSGNDNDSNDDSSSHDSRNSKSNSDEKIMLNSEKNIESNQKVIVNREINLISEISELEVDESLTKVLTANSFILFILFVGLMFMTARKRRFTEVQ